MFSNRYVSFHFSEEEKKSRDEMARLREAVDQAKCAFEEDVQKQNMEIANLKDTLLEARRASKGKKFIHKLKFDFVLSCILYYI